MFRKVNASHPNKVADRIAGAIVDLAYSKKKNPRIIVDVELTKDLCKVNVSTDVDLDGDFDIKTIVEKIIGVGFNYECNISKIDGLRKMVCTNHGTFEGHLVNNEERRCVSILRSFYDLHNPGECVLDNNIANLKLSGIDADASSIKDAFKISEKCNIDTNFTFDGVARSNMEIYSDLGIDNSKVFLHGRDLSDPNVTLSIYNWIRTNYDASENVSICKEGDDRIGNVPYMTIVNKVREYIARIGGFEGLGEWGLIRPYGFGD